MRVTDGVVRLLRIALARVRERVRKYQDPLCLQNFERRVHSQNGEDGLLEEVFRRIGTHDRFFVECGAGSGDVNNTRYLVEEKGWSGIWIEADGECCRAARRRVAGRPVEVVQALLTAENVAGLFASLSVAREPDLITIDIDGNDYWVWKALSGYRPRVWMIEYNAAFLPGEEWVLPYDAQFRWDGTSRFGASLESLAGLGTALDYRLVGCDRSGVNALFVRNDLAMDRFPGGRDRVSACYMSPKYDRRHYGHPPPRRGFAGPSAP